MDESWAAEQPALMAHAQKKKFTSATLEEGPAGPGFEEGMRQRGRRGPVKQGKGMPRRARSMSSEAVETQGSSRKTSLLRDPCKFSHLHSAETLENIIVN